MITPPSPQTYTQTWTHSPHLHHIVFKLIDIIFTLSFHNEFYDLNELWREHAGKNSSCWTSKGSYCVKESSYLYVNQCTFVYRAIFYLPYVVVFTAGGGGVAAAAIAVGIFKFVCFVYFLLVFASCLVLYCTFLSYTPVVHLMISCSVSNSL